jgi:hypothetical protein
VLGAVSLINKQNQDKDMAQVSKERLEQMRMFRSTKPGE